MQTEWVLTGLVARPELNGRRVRIQEDLIDGRYTVSLLNSCQRFRVRPTALRTANGVDPIQWQAAFGQLRTNDDPVLREFAARFARGDLDGAIASAGKWTLRQTAANSSQ